MNNYTLISFLPSYDDYCMGCHMGSWGEEFDIEVNLDEDELEAKWIAALLKAHKNTSPAKLEVTVLKNGQPMHSSGDAHVETDWVCSREYYNLEDEAEETGDYDALEAAEAHWNKEQGKFLALQKRVEGEVQALIEQAEAEAKEKEDQKQAKEKARRQDLRKKEYNKLKKEFDNEGL